MDRIDLATQTYRANKARIEQLIEDTAQKRAESQGQDDYWHGVEIGLRRALMVIEGKG